jgi:hypothetical protein
MFADGGTRKGAEETRMIRRIRISFALEAQRVAIISLLLICAYAPSSQAEEGSKPSVVACTAQPTGNAKTRQRFESTPLMAVAGELESQGEANFHLKYAAPAAECVVETFATSDATVTARYNPWEKGLSTLHYRFVVDRPAGRNEVLVIYSGTASLLKGGYVFHVSEEKDGVISWYAMFGDDPLYASVRALVEQIVGGTAKPLLAVRWPKGAKEGELVAFDDKRLK